jgi:ethanolamine utilization protein EutA
VTDLTALDVGARLICLDPAGRIVRVEEAGRRFGAELGISLEPGVQPGAEALRALAALMADRLLEAMGGGSPQAGGSGLLRLAALSTHATIDQVTFSGGVAEYIYGREAETYGDLGVLLGQEIRARVEGFGPKLEPANEGIRATVIGASQYTTQVSGSTIYVSPLEALPLRNVPVIAPAFALDRDEIESAAVAAAIQAVLKRLDLAEADTPVAVFVPWRGSATFQRLDAFCEGVADGLAPILADGHPLVLVGDGDVGGLIGIHLREEMQIENAIVSVDGLELKEFDYIDIGAMLPNSGAVPVVIKSLIFPASAAPGMEWQPKPRAVAERA